MNRHYSRRLTTVQPPAHAPHWVKYHCPHFSSAARAPATMSGVLRSMRESCLRPRLLQMATLLAVAAARPPWGIGVAATPPSLGLPIAAEGWHSAADATAVVLCDRHVRITVLTERVFRAEWVPDEGTFEDRSSLAFVNRRLPAVPSFSVANTSQWCNITLRAGLVIAYSKGGGAAPLNGVYPSEIQDISSNRSGAVPPPPPSCTPIPRTDVVCRGRCERVSDHPNGLGVGSVAACCAACLGDHTCSTWVYATAPNSSSLAGSGGTAHSSSIATPVDCYLLANGTVIGSRAAAGRESGGVLPPPAPSPGPTPPPPVSPLVGRLHAWDRAGGWSWVMGTDMGGELLGTLAKTPSADLAGCCTNTRQTNGTTTWDPKYPLQPGILSRRGWAVIEDNTSLVDNVGWISPCSTGHGGGGDGCGRRPGAFDTYLFGCGHGSNAYTTCLRDYSKLAGSMALPPMHAFGIWWSRHWGDSFDGNLFGPMSEAVLEAEVIQVVFALD